MRGTLIVAILLSVLLTIFALANNELIEINYILGKLENVPLALVILLALAAGVLIMVLFNIPSWWKHRQEKSALKKEIQQLKKQLAELENQLKATATAVQDDFMNDVEKE